MYALVPLSCLAQVVCNKLNASKSRLISTHNVHIDIYLYICILYIIQGSLLVFIIRAEHQQLLIIIICAAEIKSFVRFT